MTAAATPTKGPHTPSNRRVRHVPQVVNRTPAKTYAQARQLTRSLAYEPPAALRQEVPALDAKRRAGYYLPEADIGLLDHLSALLFPGRAGASRGEVLSAALRSYAVNLLGREEVDEVMRHIADALVAYGQRESDYPQPRSAGEGQPA